MSASNATQLLARALKRSDELSKLPLTRTPSGSLGARWVPLINTLLGARRSNLEGAVVLFTSTAPGDGVSFVVDSLSRELNRTTGQRTLAISASQLAGPPGSDIEGITESAPDLFSLMGGDKTRSVSDLYILRENVRSLRSRFDWVLVDCPSLRNSSDALSAAPYADAVVLVVSAGRTRRDQIRKAQRAIEISKGKFMGVVLNKRKYPIPNFLYRWLG
jgi:hypothetical protein